jgi:hypothetical protein
MWGWGRYDTTGPVFGYGAVCGYGASMWVLKTLNPLCAGFSRQMVALLQELNVEFSSFNILMDEEVKQGTRYGWVLGGWVPFQCSYLHNSNCGQVSRYEF